MVVEQEPNSEREDDPPCSQRQWTDTVTRRMLTCQEVFGEQSAVIRREVITMCSPLCLEALYGSASRRVFVKKSLMAATAVVCGARAASGAAVAQQPRSFTNVLDLTHPLYEGFPTFDGSKWFTMEKK